MVYTYAKISYKLKKLVCLLFKKSIFSIHILFDDTFLKRLENDLHFYVTYLYLFQMKVITLLLVCYMLFSARNAEDTVSFCILHTSNSEPSNAAMHFNNLDCIVWSLIVLFNFAIILSLLVLEKWRLQAFHTQRAITL